MKLRCLVAVVAASSGLDGLIKIWNLSTGQIMRSIDGGPGNPSCQIRPPNLMLQT